MDVGLFLSIRDACRVPVVLQRWKDGSGGTRPVDERAVAVH
jgi:hypothetical protein